MNSTTNGQPPLYAGPPQRWCVEFSSPGKAHNPPADLLAGRFYLFAPGAEDYSLDAMPWRVSETDHPSWTMWLHSLKWIDRLISAELEGESDETSDEITRAREVAHSWIDWDLENAESAAWHGHPAALRLTTLVGLSEALPEDAKIHSAILRHIEHLSQDENFDGLWNHGLVQSIGLLAAGLRVADVAALRIARDRIWACVAEMVDDEGAINEQAPGYSRYIYHLIQIVLRVYVENQVPGRSNIRERLEAMHEFIAHATMPNGRYVQIGDTYAEEGPVARGTTAEFARTQGMRGVRPSENTAIFKRGYVFARSGWGESRRYGAETYLSMRFGPQRMIHGHNDHMSVTYYAREREIIVDAGHFGYADGDYRNYLRSPEAHSLLQVLQARHDWSADTQLTRSEKGIASSFFECSDEAYLGVPRTRGVLYMPEGPLVVVDRASSVGSPKWFRQLWHLAPEFTFASADEGSVRFTSALGDCDVVLVRHAVSPERLSNTVGTYLTKGSDAPIQGWVSRRQEERVPAPVVGFDYLGETLMMITSVLVVDRGEPVSSSLREGDGGKLILRLHVGGKSHRVRVSRGGHLAI